jgi:hypothetical protein
MAALGCWRHSSLENVSDPVPQCRRDGIARHFDRLRARCRLARDAITKRISFARVRPAPPSADP